MIKAVIDVGSNSVLLLVAEKRGSEWHTIKETTAVTALGEDTRTSGILNERAITDTLAALKEAFAVARNFGAETITAAVTMAGRIARNTGDFLELARAQGTPATVLSGEDEARLGFLAVVNDPAFSPSEAICIIDVGGHSTEIVCTDAFSKSFPVGTLGLRETVLRDEAPDFAARMNAVQQIDDILGEDGKLGGMEAWRHGENSLVVALGATGTNLVTIRDRMTEWDPAIVHGAELDYEEISRAVGWMCAMTDAERAAIPGIEKGREKTLHIGALILERSLYALKADRCFVSVKGWRHAMLDCDDTMKQLTSK